MTFSMLELQHERKKSARTPTHTRTTLKFVQPAIQFFRVTPRYDGDWNSPKTSRNSRTNGKTSYLLSATFREIWKKISTRQIFPVLSRVLMWLYSLVTNNTSMRLLYFILSRDKHLSSIIKKTL